MGIDKDMATGITSIESKTLTEGEEKQLLQRRKGCRGCHLPCGKMKTNWWSPGQIEGRFCSKQVQFLLANFGTLIRRPAKWPSKPSGYISIDLDVQQSMTENITWQQIIEVRGQLLLRIVKLPELMQNLIYDKRIAWDAEWPYMVDDVQDERVRRRLLQAAHDMVNYLRGKWKTVMIGGKLKAVNVAYEMSFVDWQRQRQNRDKMKGKEN
jgi:hypothetical protein